jgi:4-diphosphocytidyl-2C-methyl-D-erythritol kinase
MTARISGSGPTAFGVFATLMEAEAAAATLENALVTQLRKTPTKK